MAVIRFNNYKRCSPQLHHNSVVMRLVSSRAQRVPYQTLGNLVQDTINSLSLPQKFMEINPSKKVLKSLEIYVKPTS